MDTPYETYDVACHDHNYRVQYIYDSYADPPWENSDGHGVVRKTTSGSPQERRLSDAYFYDWQASMERAKKGGWGLPEEEAVGLTPGQIIEKAVQKDFEYLKGWCTGAWQYVMVNVFPLDAEGNELKSRAKSLGMLESSDEDYLKQVAFDLIEEIIT